MVRTIELVLLTGSFVKRWENAKTNTPNHPYFDYFKFIFVAAVFLLRFENQQGWGQ